MGWKHVDRCDCFIWSETPVQTSSGPGGRNLKNPSSPVQLRVPPLRLISVTWLIFLPRSSFDSSWSLHAETETIFVYYVWFLNVFPFDNVDESHCSYNKTMSIFYRPGEWPGRGLRLGSGLPSLPHSPSTCVMLAAVLRPLAFHMPFPLPWHIQPVLLPPGRPQLIPQISD